MTQALSPSAKYVSHLPALFGLLALVARIHRRHLTGDTLFLGNFDRLNRFLNTVWLRRYSHAIARPSRNLSSHS